jgi:hypothetical protein
MAAPLPPPPQARGAPAIVDVLWAERGGGGCSCSGACGCGYGACVVATGEELVPATLLRQARRPGRKVVYVVERHHAAERLNAMHFSVVVLLFRAHRRAPRWMRWRSRARCRPARRPTRG